jgi:hypothetical protein
MGLVSGLWSRRDLALENVALRQQLMVLRRRQGNVQLKDRDRLFWVGLQRGFVAWPEEWDISPVPRAGIRPLGSYPASPEGSSC